MNLRTFRCIVKMTALAGVSLLSARAAVAQNNVIINIGALGVDGYKSFAYGINVHGQIVGRADSPAGSRAFTWNLAMLSNTINLIDIGPQEARAVNDNGLAAGFGFSYDTLHATTTPLPPVSAGGFVSQAFGINNAGVVVGQGYPATGPYHAFVYDTTTANMTDLGVLLGSGSSTAYAINSTGQVVGTGFVWDRAHGLTSVHNPIGGFNVTLTAINANGVAVGYEDDAIGVNHAIRYDTRTSQFTELAALPGAASESFAYGINNGGQIVGSSDDFVTQQLHAVRWDTDGTITDLNTLVPSSPEWYLFEARSINDAGQIAGLADCRGTTRAFVRTPRPGGYSPAADVSSQVQVQRGGFRYQIATGEWVQLVRVKNTGIKPIPGSFTLTVESLPYQFPDGFGQGSYIHLANADGEMRCQAPICSPYVNFGPDASHTLHPGETTTVTLRFTKDPNLSLTPITYTTHVFAGSGLR